MSHRPEPIVGATVVFPERDTGTTLGDATVVIAGDTAAQMDVRRPWPPFAGRAAAIAHLGGPAKPAYPPPIQCIAQLADFDACSRIAGQRACAASATIGSLCERDNGIR